jgi:hypothetical protein
MTSPLPGPVTSTDAIRLDLQTWPDVDAYLEQCKA